MVQAAQRPRFARVVQLVEAPFSASDAGRYGVADLAAKGLAVLVLDLSRVLQPKSAPAAPPPGVDVVTPASRAEAEAALARLGASDCAVVNVFLRRETLWVFRALARRGVWFGLCKNASQPVSGIRLAPAGDREPALARLARRGRAAAGALLVRHPWLVGVKAADFVILDGRVPAQRFRKFVRPTGPATRVIHTQSLDYDRYLQSRSRPALLPGVRYALFIDQCLPSHPDFARNGMAPPATPERYYAALARFFAALTAATGLEVVVAVHPKGDEAAFTRMPGVRIIKGETPVLIRDAALVLAHYSTAISFAAMFGRPVAFLTTDELEASGWAGEATRLYAAALRGRVLNLDHEAMPEPAALLAVDPPAVAEFIANYVKLPGTAEAPGWAIFADEIQRTC